MFFSVFKSLVTFQIHETIFARNNPSSTDKVCPTARFEKRTPENKGQSEDYPSEKGISDRE